MNETALSAYIADSSRRHSLAREIGTSPQYLWQLAKRWRGRQPSPLMAVKIETATGGEVTRHDLRPDLFDPPADAAAASGEGV